MAQSADVINIFAHPEDSEDPETALSFLISPKLAGIRVEHNWNTLGMRATKSDNLVLEDVFAPEESLYCAIPNAGIFVSESEPLYNLPYTAVYLGIAVGALAAAKQAVHQRQPRGYNQSLAYHPDIRRRIAQAAAQVDAARLMVRDCAWRLDREGQTPAVTASYFKTSAKLLKCHSYLEVCDYKRCRQDLEANTRCILDFSECLPFFPESKG